MNGFVKFILFIAAMFIVWFIPAVLGLTGAVKLLAYIIELAILEVVVDKLLEKEDDT